MDYKEQIKHPKWQKKRTIILNRDNFQCQCCFDKENTLHVHHKEYIKGRMIWDYDNDYLITLCEECHDTIHRFVDNNETAKTHCMIWECTPTDYKIFHVRMQQLIEQQGKFAMKTVIQLITAQIIKEGDMLWLKTKRVFYYM